MIKEDNRYFYFKIRKDLPILKIKKKGSMKNIFGVKIEFEIIKMVQIPQTKFPDEPKKIKGKVYALQRLRFENGDIYFRFGYYIIAEKPKMKGKWIWGQYCPIGPVEDFKRIVEEAKKEGFF